MAPTGPDTNIALLGQSNALGGANATPVPTNAVPSPGELWTYGVLQTNYGADGRVGVEQLLEPARKVTKSAVGGTAIAEWLAVDGLLDDAFAHAIAAGLVPKVTIWIQGEADAAGDGGWPTYAASLETLLSRIDAEWGPQDLVVIPLLSGNARPRQDEINAAFAAVAATRPEIVLVETSDLQKWDGVHYTRAGYTALAARILAEIEAIEAP